MSFPTLWHSMTILPATPASERKTLPLTVSADLDPNLPPWERQPARGLDREAGRLDPTWVHRHLP
jgi:hypothetical protein